MLSRTRTGTFGTCGARTLLGEAYRATPLGGVLGSHPPTLYLPRRTAADHHLPKVFLDDGLSDDFYAVRPVTTFSHSYSLLLCDIKCVLGRCIVPVCRKLSAKQTGVEHTRRVCRDALPHACRDV